VKIDSALGVPRATEKALDSGARYVGLRDDGSC
jgi:hypothetical protein